MKTVEFNSKFQRAEDTFCLAKSVVMITPPVGQDYWLFRVQLFKDQAIIGFPKFSTIGIGFAVEDKDWNTNLPYSFDAGKIYNHIHSNKKYKAISKTDCIQAIELIAEQCEAFEKLTKAKAS